MSVSVTCPQCGTVCQAPDDLVGKTGRCAKCQTRFPIHADPVVVTTLDLADLVSSPASPTPAPPTNRHYKVLTQKDKWFSGKFDPAALEQALNSYAQQGWVVKAAVTASIPGFGGNRDELVVILER